MAILAALKEINSKEAANESYPTQDTGNEDMSVTRYELDAKCQAIEARMDARVQNIENIAKQIHDENKEIKTELKNTKWQILALCVGLFAAVVGILAITNSWQQTNLNIMTSRLDKVSDALSDNNQKLEKIVGKKLNTSK